MNVHHSKPVRSAMVIALLAFLGVFPALAGGPEHEQIRLEGGDLLYCDVDGVFVPHDDNGDGWPESIDGYEYLVEGRYQVLINQFTFYDQDGNPFQYRAQGVFHGTLTRLDTHQFITEKQAWADTWDALDYITNHAWHVWAPGEGTVFHDAGRVIFDIETGTWDVEFLAGHHPSLEGNNPEYCGLLGSGHWVASHPL